MIRTIGWLLFIWIFVGWGSVIVYTIGSPVTKAFILHFKEDNKGKAAVFDAGKQTQLWLECYQDYCEEHPYMANHNWVQLLRWDILAKTYLMSTGRLVNETYGERLKLLKQKDGEPE